MSALTMRNLAPDARAQFHARKTPGRSKHVMRQRQAALGRHTEWIEEEPTQAELDEVREVESRARRRPTDEGPDELADENEQLRQMVRKLEAEAELGLRPSPSPDAPLVATGVPPPQQLIRSSSGAQMPAGVPPPPQQLSRSSSGARVATSVPPPQQQQQLGRSRSMGAAGRGRGRGSGSAPAPARDGRTITREMAEARTEAQAAQRELREYQSREDAARQRDEMDAASLAELRLQLDEARASAAREAADAASEAAETAAERSRLREELAAANAELFGLRSPGGGDDDGEGDGGGSGGGAAAMRAAIEVARAEGAERAAAARAEGAATARAEAAARHTEELAAARRAGAAEAVAVAVAAEAARRQQKGMGAEASAARTTLQEQLKAARAEVDELTGTLREAHEVARTATAVAGGRALELRALLQMHTVQTEAHRALQRELASTRARLASALAQAEAFYWEARAERGRAQAGEEERCEAQDELDEARRRAVLVQADLHEARLDLRIEASRTAGIRARATALVGGSGAAEQPATAAAAATPTMTPTVSAADLVLHSDALAEDTTKRASASSRVVAEYGLDELLLSASHAKLGR